MEANKFQKIGQYRHTLKALRNNGVTAQNYTGTVKLHGTNASIVYKRTLNENGVPDLRITFQSRKGVIEQGKDNCGFAGYMASLEGDALLKILIPQWTKHEEVVVYGEWCGQGIQSGCGVHQLPKMFVIFAVKVDDVYLDQNEVSQFGLFLEEQNIYNIYSFPTYILEVDIDTPELAQAIASRVTLEVEEECPVAKHFGVSGIGEGIVWTPTSATLRQDVMTVFKTKGQKHSASKVKTIAALTPEELDKVNKVKAFVEYALTDVRLKQGIEYLEEDSLPLDKSSTGKYISWVMHDALLEEADTLDANELTEKEVKSKLGQKARQFYFDYIGE